MESRNIFDLLGKIDWEGGMYETISGYGMSDIDDYDVPDYLKEQWEGVASLAYDLREELEDLFDNLNIYSHKYGNKEEDE
jgi:hypothetical protein